MSEEAAFLAALEANPADDTTRLVYADWLDEHGESAKAEYLRLVAALASKSGKLTGEEFEAVQLLGVGESIPLEWRSSVGSHFRVVLHELGPQNDKVRVIKCIREVANYGLGDAKIICETPSSNVLECVPFEYAIAVRDYIERESGASVELYSSTLSRSQIVARYHIIASYSVWRTDRPQHTVRSEAQLAFAQYIATARDMDLIAARKLTRKAEMLLAEGLELFQATQRLEELRRLLPVKEENAGWNISINVCPTQQ